MMGSHLANKKGMDVLLSRVNTIISIEQVQHMLVVLLLVIVIIVGAVTCAFEDISSCMKSGFVSLLNTSSLLKQVSN